MDIICLDINQFDPSVSQSNTDILRLGSNVFLRHFVLPQKDIMRHPTDICNISDSFNRDAKKFGVTHLLSKGNLLIFMQGKIGVNNFTVS